MGIVSFCNPITTSRITSYKEAPVSVESENQERYRERRESYLPLPRLPRGWVGDMTVGSEKKTADYLEKLGEQIA
jgi:hypothetical protein